MHSKHLSFEHKHHNHNHVREAPDGGAPPIPRKNASSLSAEQLEMIDTLVLGPGNRKGRSFVDDTSLSG